MVFLCLGKKVILSLENIKYYEKLISSFAPYPFHRLRYYFYFIIRSTFFLFLFFLLLFFVVLLLQSIDNSLVLPMRFFLLVFQIFRFTYSKIFTKYFIEKKIPCANTKIFTNYIRITFLNVARDTFYRFSNCADNVRDHRGEYIILAKNFL